MSSFNRRNKILSIIEKEELISTDKLSEMLNVSPSTIRRDITKLASKNLVTKIHGGVTKANTGINVEISKNRRFVSNLDKKNNISDKAIEFIKNNSTIFMDSSSTCYQLAKKLNKFNNLSIVSNGIHSLSLLSEYRTFRIYSISGEIKNNEDIVGPLACQSIKNYKCDILFFSCSAFSIASGLTDATIDNSHVKKEMLLNSKLKIALIDSTKFDKNFFSTLASIDQIDYLITDKKPDDKYIDLLKDKLIY